MGMIMKNSVPYGGSDVTKAYVDEQISTLSASTTISATATTSPITDAANGVFQKLTVQGESRESKNQLHITADTGAQSGVTFTVNRNSGGEVESIFVNGTNTSTGYIHYNIGTYTSTMNGCVLSGCPSGGSSDTYRLWVLGFPITNDIGEGVMLELAGIATSGSIGISIGPGYTASNLVFRPMVCTAAEYEANPTFEPHGIISVGENGSVTLTSANSGNTVSTTATFTTGMPLLSANDVYDELDCAAGVVHKRCEYDSENETVTALAIPYDIPLTDSEKAAFRSLRTYAGTTNLSITDDPEFTATYTKNSENGQAVADVQTGLQEQILQFASIIIGVPENHRNIFRGKNLGDYVTSAQENAIKNGSFDDLYIGDYWQTDANTKWRVADMDYMLGCGDTPLTVHHLVIVPDTCLYNAKMNDENITTGGYVGSKMYTENLNQAKTTINSLFVDMVLSHREYLVNAVSNGKASGGAWLDSTIDLMNESMVYGHREFTPANDGTTIPYNYTIDKSQLALFQIAPKFITNRATWWLRDIASAVHFACVFGAGFTDADGASGSHGVRPVFAIGVAE